MAADAPGRTAEEERANPSRIFIVRPVATSLLMIAILLVGAVGFFFLPLSALPEVDYPTIQVQTFLPGASPEVMTSSVTAPLERQFGQMPGLREMSSTSSAGASVLTLQFDLSLNLDIAEQEVQAAINAAGNLLPQNLPAPPIYAKVNPADAPILTIAVTSKSMTLTGLEDIADTRIAQKISQLPGVGLVSIGGGLRPAVRVQANLQSLAAYGLNIDDLRTTIGNANVNTPKGNFDGPARAYTINANDQLQTPEDYKNLIIAYRNGAPVHLSDVADVVESAENTKLASWMNDTPAILLNVQRQPGANVIAVADSVKQLLPDIGTSLPASVDVAVLTDRTNTIRASVTDVEFELALAVALVVLVIFLFLRNVPATIIPSLSVPLSLVGTFAAMYLLGYSLNNLSLMALTIASGFVVDDAIVMIENVARHLELGEKPFQAAIKGSGEIAFTIISLTVSLIAVLIPLLFMQEVVGRLFREFAVTLAITILISAVVSLTLVPMMCAKLLKPESKQKHGKVARKAQEYFDRLIHHYGRSLDWVLDHQPLTLLVAVATLALTIVLYVVIPKGFFPVQDTGLIQGITRAGPEISFSAMSERQRALADAIRKDPDVVSLSSFIGVDGSNATLNSGRVLINLKPKTDRGASISDIIRRIQTNARSVTGISLFLQPVQDLTVESTVGRAQYQFMLQAASGSTLDQWVPILIERLRQTPQLENVSTDYLDRGLSAYIQVDRDTAARFGVTAATIDNALYDSFGQRIVSTMYTQSNQYRVILEADPDLQASLASLNSIYLPSAGGGQVPLSAIASVEERTGPLEIGHLGQFPSAMVSFDVAANASLGEAVDAIEKTQRDIGLPGEITTSFQGAALAFQSALGNELLLILAAIVTVYIVLGVLYESFIHPVTILSTLPSAGVGALLALIVTGHDLNIISIIGIILLIGIVKKNAIMMIDFAITAQREENKAPREAIHQAACLRFRPILMTTVSAVFGALPLMVGFGTGSELRHPLGIAIVGGLLVSQLLTLFTTPVIYLGFERTRRTLGLGRRQAIAEKRGTFGPMNFPALFIARPVATTLLAIGLALAGLAALFLLPVSPLPNVDYPTISVTAQLPGASPETVATSVATPLERHLGTIADVTEMTSSSSVGQTRITLQFNLNRDIEGAARDVQAAINAARVDLPAALRSNPTYRKVNPADAPILILALTSETLTPGQIYDSASTVLQQKLSQVDGVGEVQVGGSSLPAVRVELNPRALFKYGIGLEDVRAAIAAANANAPKGAIEQSGQHLQIYVNDQASTAAQFRTLIVAYRNGAAVRLEDIADVSDGVEDVRNLGSANGKPAVLIIINRQPGANIIDVVDRIKAMVPRLQASIPSSITVTPVNDRTTTIRASLRDVENTMLIAVVLVVIVVFLFLRNGRAALVPCVAVPLSLLGTFGAMYLLGFSLDNLSLMALTVATGFVVDDAIVVLENISRHVEDGVPRMQAALMGAREVGFTVLSMSVSLIAVFLPILLMGGIMGRLFHEFAYTLSIAIIISLALSLTLTPMMCAYFGIRRRDKRHGRGGIFGWSEALFARALRGYDRSLSWSLDNPGTIIFILALTVGLNVYLFTIVPKGFFPQQDTGSIIGGIRADQSISFQAMQPKFNEFVKTIHDDPAVDSVVGFSGRGGQTNSGFVFINLKPLSERQISADRVIARLRNKLANVAGARLFLQPVQDLRIGGRQGNAQYQYTIQADALQDLETWVPKITAALQNVPELEDVNSDRQEAGLDVELKIDRATASRLGITAQQIDNTLYDAFGQRQISTIYQDLNQYHVVMEVAPTFWQNPETLRDIYISTAGNISGTQSTGAVAGTTSVAATPSAGATAASTTTTTSTALDVASDAVRNQSQNAIASTVRGAASTGASVSTRVEKMVPLSTFSRFAPGLTPLSVNHQGPFVATTFSFNLPENEPLSTAVAAIQRTMAELHVPISVHGTFAGNARAFQQSLSNEPILILAAIVTVYIVLGVLYESLVHPITILSTLPSAGVGAVLALLLFGAEFSLIALIGVILLIGIVKKNAIMMIDFALTAQRNGELDRRAAIHTACMLRFRPIMMTTMAAIFAALPLALITGDGAELRQPLGISIMGGLIVSQALTLYTTPVVYLYLDRFRAWGSEHWRRFYGSLFRGRGIQREVRG